MKPVLIAMNNPHSDDPRHALYPAPQGTAGYRLWQMLAEVRPGVTRVSYRDAFDRRNLVLDRVWDSASARGAAALLDFPPGTVVVVLGDEVRRALGLRPCLIHPTADLGLEGVYTRQLPHPSGRCRWYNHPTHRLLAGLLLAELYDQSREDHP